MAVDVVERFKQEAMYGLSAGTKKSDRCRELAVVERWSIEDVRLYTHSLDTKWRKMLKYKMRIWVVSMRGESTDFVRHTCKSTCE